MISVDVYHTQEKRDDPLSYPLLATGNHQWFGDGFYFWEDLTFACHWGRVKKINKNSDSYSVYLAVLNYQKEEIIDTVFNEEDYVNFVRAVERFAEKFKLQYKKTPSLYEFNEFISHFQVWHEIKIIKFQDLTNEKTQTSVRGFPYKKRIQYRVNDPEKITTFAHLFDKQD
jgi:hypothetical protein